MITTGFEKQKPIIQSVCLFIWSCLRGFVRLSRICPDRTASEGAEKQHTHSRENSISVLDSEEPPRGHSLESPRWRARRSCRSRKLWSADGAEKPVGVGLLLVFRSVERTLIQVHTLPLSLHNLDLSGLSFFTCRMGMLAFAPSSHILRCASRKWI